MEAIRKKKSKNRKVETGEYFILFRSVDEGWVERRRKNQPWRVIQGAESNEAGR